MMLIEETAVPQSALPVQPFRDHLRLGTGFADDDLQEPVLTATLRAAIAAVEARTGKILIEREFSWSITCWRTTREQALPVAPVSAITQVVLIDASGAETLAAPALSRLVPDLQRPKLCATGASLPRIPAGGSARIGFLAGFGPEWSDLPADLSQAVLILAAHYYDYRHDVRMGGGALPYSVNALIERYRTLRLSLGGQA